MSFEVKIWNPPSRENPCGFHFTLSGRLLQALEIIDRWDDPECRYLKVRASDNYNYLLREDYDSGEWSLVKLERSERMLLAT